MKTITAASLPSPSSPAASKRVSMMLAKGFIPATWAAQRFGVVLGTVYNWIRGGKVISLQAGSARYVNAQSVLDHYGSAGASILGITLDLLKTPIDRAEAKPRPSKPASKPATKPAAKPAKPKPAAKPTKPKPKKAV